MKTDYFYPATFERDETGTYVVSPPNLPDPLIGADDIKESIDQEEDCLVNQHHDTKLPTQVSALRMQVSIVYVDEVA